MAEVPPTSAPDAPATGRIEHAVVQAVHRFEGAVGKARRFSRGPTRWVALAIGAGLFAAQVILAWRNLPSRDLSVHAFVVLVVLGTPLNLAASGLEFALAAAMLGQPTTPVTVGRVSVASSFSNLLPLPGSAMVRAASLRAGGAGYRRLAAAVGGQGAAFLATTGVLCGSVLLAGGHPGVATVAMGLGLAAAVASLRLVATTTDHPFVWFGRIVLAEIFVVAVTAARIALAAMALGLPVGAAEVAGLTAASVAATATGVFPGGLGIREAFSGAIAPMLGLEVSAGVMIGAVDRVGYLLGMAVVAGLLLVTPTGRRLLRPRAAASGDDARVDTAAEPP